MIQVAFECFGQDLSVTCNRNSLWNSWSKVRIGWRFVTLQEDQGWISASWIYPPSFFPPVWWKPCPMPQFFQSHHQSLTEKQEPSNRPSLVCLKQHTFTHASLCRKSVHECSVGEACVSVCVCLSYAHPSRMHSKQAILDASREQVQGENLFPLLDLRKSIKDGLQVTAHSHHWSVRAHLVLLICLFPFTCNFPFHHCQKFQDVRYLTLWCVCVLGENV